MQPPVKITVLKRTLCVQHDEAAEFTHRLSAPPYEPVTNGFGGVPEDTYHLSKETTLTPFHSPGGDLLQEALNGSDGLKARVGESTISLAQRVNRC